MRKRGIEFSICTYNRVSYLKKCIEALLPQVSLEETTISVIDNRSTDETKAYVLQLAKSNSGIRYIQELSSGLSHARNRAWKDSRFQWVFYLDDDCIPADDLVDQALQLILHQPIADMYGGIIWPMFESKPPQWLPADYGIFSMPFEKLTVVDKGYARGGCMMISVQALQEVGGFNTSLGMKGSEMRYGEEIDLQVRMRKMGYKIAYAPQLKTGHFVRNEKIRLIWMLSSEYARNRDKMVFAPITFKHASLNLLRTLAGRIVWMPIHLGTIVIHKKYTWRNAILDALLPLAHRTGEWIGTIQNTKAKWSSRKKV